MTRISRVRWAHAYRVINSRYPPIDVFERVADPADWDTLMRLEALTNPRVRQEWGEIALVPAGERVTGPGASWVMAAFAHIARHSRFSDGSYGVYYASAALETAIRETAFHFGRFLVATAEPRGSMLELRALVSTGVDQRYHDLRTGHPELHLPDDYRPSQAFARPLREAGSNGIVYRSVRDPGGRCLAVLRPRAITLPVQGPHLRYHFDGARIDRWLRLGDPDWHALGSQSA